MAGHRESATNTKVQWKSAVRVSHTFAMDKRDTRMSLCQVLRWHAVTLANGMRQSLEKPWQLSVR